MRNESHADRVFTDLGDFHRLRGSGINLWVNCVDSPGQNEGTRLKELSSWAGSRNVS